MLELVAAMVVAVAAGAPATPLQSSGGRVAPRAPRATPPSLSAGALAAELRESGRRRLDELAELQRERARLEQLATEIAVARRELARESALLDEKATALERARAAEAKRSDARSPHAPASPVPADAEVAGLAKTVKGMKPEQAAALVGRLAKPLAVAVLQKLRPPDAAAVLGRMPASEAAELFTLMAQRGASPP